MSSLKSMQVGYRFHPNDQELIDHYLKLKNQGQDRYVSNIREIDVCSWEPWDLPGHLGSESDDQKWYFFSRRDFKYGNSNRAKRTTKDGFWKSTGKDRYIKLDGSKKVIGTKKTLVFHKGRNQNASRTYWVMHEYLASADKDNRQAFVLYLLKKKTDESVEIPNTDGAELNVSSPSSLFPNNVPSNSPSTPTVHQDDDFVFQCQAFERLFGGQEPSYEALERFLLGDVCPNQETIHMIARFVNVSNNDPGVTQFQNIKRLEFVNSIINSATSRSLRTPDNVPFDSESGTETDYDVPQSLFGEDAVHGGRAYLSDPESWDQKFYNDIILAQEVSLSGNSDVIQHLHPKAGSDDSSVESQLEAKSSTHLEVAGNKSSGTLGKSSDRMGFIVYVENPRVSKSNGTTPPSNYIRDIAIGIFMTVVITGEVLFGLVN